MNASHRLLITLLFAAVLTSAACGSNSAQDGASSSGASPANSTGAPAAPDNTASTQPSTTAPTDLSFSALKVIQTARLEISVDSVVAAYGRVTDAARMLGGYVGRAEVRQQDGNPFASIQLRVPAPRHEEMLTSIKALPGARLDNESTSSKEISGEYTDLESRIRNLERTEAQYQQFLTQAKTIDEVLNVSGRLQSTRDEIERARGRLALYDSQVEYTSIELQIATLVPPVAASEPPTSERATPARVLASGWETTKDLARLTVVALTASLFVIAWLLPLCAVLLLSVRLYRRFAPVVTRLLQ